MQKVTKQPIRNQGSELCLDTACHHTYKSLRAYIASYYTSYLAYQFYIQLVYKAPLSFTLRIQILSNSLPISNSYLNVKAQICIFLTVMLKLNYCKKVFFFLIHLFARDVLVMKKLKIEKTKPNFIISILKVSFFDFQLFY